MTKRWVVTGCSSGLGRSLAESLARSGVPLLATARNPATIADLAGYPGVVTAPLDVRDAGACQAAISTAVDRLGGVDVLVNNAGYGQFGAVEEVSDAELSAQFDTNVFGPWRMLRAVLPLWREQGSGHAIFVSSAAGTTPFPGLSSYGASKAALEALAAYLAAEAGQFGVRSTVLQLGPFATRYGDTMREPDAPVPAYVAVNQPMLTGIRALSRQPEISYPAELFAKLVRKVAAMPEPPPQLAFGLGVEDYLGATITARCTAFTDSVAAGRHLPSWLED